MKIIEVVETAVGHSFTRQSVALQDVDRIKKAVTELLAPMSDKGGDYGELAQNLSQVYDALTKTLEQYIKLKRKHDKDAKYYANLMRKDEKEKLKIEKVYASSQKHIAQLKEMAERKPEYQDLYETGLKALDAMKEQVEEEQKYVDQRRADYAEIMKTEREMEDQCWEAIEEIIKTDI